MQPCVTDEFRSHLGQAAVSAAKVMSFKIVLLMIVDLQFANFVTMLSDDHCFCLLEFFSFSNVRHF